MDRTPQPNSVSTTQTTFRVIESLQEHDGARVSELAADLDVAKSTIHRHLTALQDLEYVVKEGDRYQLGLRFLALGRHVQSSKVLYRMAKAKVAELAETTHERSQFMVKEHNRAVYVHIERGKNAVMTDPGVGNGIPLHATSAGKAILAHLSEEERQEFVYGESLSHQTPETITDPETLLAELESIRERGYSFNEQENLRGLRAVGVPVLNNGQVLGALSVSGPTNRMDGEFFREELPSLLLGTANELELNIAHV